jgi:hypothetical protein
MTDIWEHCNGIITSGKACVLLLSEKESQIFRKGIVRPQSMVSEVRPVRGGKSPRSLAVKLTGVTAHSLPSTKSAKKQAAQKKRPRANGTRRWRRVTHEPEETRPPDTGPSEASA